MTRATYVSRRPDQVRPGDVITWLRWPDWGTGRDLSGLPHPAIRVIGIRLVKPHVAVGDPGEPVIVSMVGAAVRQTDFQTENGPPTCVIEPHPDPAVWHAAFARSLEGLVYRLYADTDKNPLEPAGELTVGSALCLSRAGRRHLAHQQPIDLEGSRVFEVANYGTNPQSHESLPLDDEPAEQPADSSRSTDYTREWIMTAANPTPIMEDVFPAEMIQRWIEHIRGQNQRNQRDQEAVRFLISRSVELDQ